MSFIQNLALGATVAAAALGVGSDTAEAAFANASFSASRDQGRFSGGLEGLSSPRYEGPIQQIDDIMDRDIEGAVLAGCLTAMGAGIAVAVFNRSRSEKVVTACAMGAVMAGIGAGVYTDLAVQQDLSEHTREISTVITKASTFSHLVIDYQDNYTSDITIPESPIPLELESKERPVAGMKIKGSFRFDDQNRIICWHGELAE